MRTLQRTDDNFAYRDLNHNGQPLCGIAAVQQQALDLPYDPTDPLFAFDHGLRYE